MNVFGAGQVKFLCIYVHRQVLLDTLLMKGWVWINPQGMVMIFKSQNFFGWFHCSLSPTVCLRVMTTTCYATKSPVFDKLLELPLSNTWAMPCSEKNYLHLVDDSTESIGLRRQDNSVLSAHKYQQKCIGMVYHVILIASTVHKAVFACCNGILNILLYSGPQTYWFAIYRQFVMSRCPLCMCLMIFPHSGGMAILFLLSSNPSTTLSSRCQTILRLQKLTFFL